jgi:hypothetical protein
MNNVKNIKIYLPRKVYFEEMCLGRYILGRYILRRYILGRRYVLRRYVLGRYILRILSNIPHHSEEIILVAIQIFIIVFG